MRGCAAVFGAEERVTALPTEMWDVDHRGRVCGTQAQDLARNHRANRLGRAEHGEGAEEPFGVDVAVKVHGRGVGGLFHFVHRLVTGIRVTAAAGVAISGGT